jgi:enediyne biosynthesis protein E4
VNDLIRGWWRAAVLMTVAACRTPSAPVEPPLFESIPPSASKIAFENRLPEDSSFNILNYLYYYNGGGVAVGDVDGDDLVDIYLTSNLGPNKLYRNRGGFRFEDVTAQAGVAGADGWTTGATMADVNGDGHLDIYVSGVTYLTQRGRNILYINTGKGTFVDQTEQWGLGQQGYGTQAAFFDFDADGDLDAYLLNHSTHTERQIGEAARRELRHPTAGDRLMRNDGSRFTDVSASAGIYGGVEGYGLGVVASDLTGDGCLDLYVANDFQENDFLYVNQCDGTFRESITTSTGHTSRFSMGVDAADINNDLRPDLFVADMLPEQEAILKSSAGAESWNLFEARLRAGYHPQYSRNTLQLNRGGGRFSEIGYLAGVFASDWSWATLFADFDDDGRKDLFVTNGIYRRPNDLDYINFVGNDAMQQSLARGVSSENLTLLQRMPQIALPNHLFRNADSLRFEDRATAWGLDEPGFSNGAAYADFDNDGALDLVVNRINAPALLYKNRARTLGTARWLTVSLKGSGANRFGVGARVFVTAGGTTQLVEQMPTRGFQSSVDPRLHIGLGSAPTIDSLTVVWPDRRQQIVRGIPSNQRITLVQDSASGRWTPPMPPSPLLVDATDRLVSPVRHVESPFVDLNREPLMPHLLSTEGPALAVGDVNGDGRDDLFVGGAKWQAGQIVQQGADGRFRVTSQPALAADSVAEDVAATFFDADGDRDLDLYVSSGGNEFFGSSDLLRDRLYLNDGAGLFTRSVDALPAFFDNGGVVAPADFDRDGDVDLFVGRRVVSRSYGASPRSLLLRNDGHGRFEDVTASLAPMLTSAGMIAAAAWCDPNADGALDLVIAGEWTPVRVLRQHNGRFEDRTEASGLARSEGWWSSLTVADVDADGRQDLVLGNLGRNAYLTASDSMPAELFVHDFGGNGTIEQILTFYKQGVRYPLPGRDDLVKLIPALRPRFPSYASFGATQIEALFPRNELAAARQLTARRFASAIAFGGPDGTFSLRDLPIAAQLAPIRAALVGDLDGDAAPDVLTAGNLFGVPTMLGRYDASYGTLLVGGPARSMVSADPTRLGFLLGDAVRHLAWVRTGPSSPPLLAVARNDAPLALLAFSGCVTSPRRAADSSRPSTVARCPSPN